MGLGKNCNEIAILPAAAKKCLSIFLAHVQVLEWFKNSGYEFLYTCNAIDYAAGNGQVHVLEWFKKSGYDFLYSCKAIDNAAQNFHIVILEWFKNSPYRFICTKRLFNTIFENYEINHWFKNYKQHIKRNKIIYYLPYQY